jgi:hypothetical protein
MGSLVHKLLCSYGTCRWIRCVQLAMSIERRQISACFCMPMGGVERWSCGDEKNNTADNKENVCQQVAGGSLPPPTGSLMCCATSWCPLSPYSSRVLSPRWVSNFGLQQGRYFEPPDMAANIQSINRTWIHVRFQARSQNCEKFILFMSVGMEQLGSLWTGFDEIWYLNSSRKSVEKIQL